MGALNSINDFLWSILDSMQLGESFDKHGIPPIVFPIFLIAVIVVAYVFLLAPSPADSPPEVTCGDAVCKTPEESPQNCPEDCGVPKEDESYSIRVYVSGGEDCDSFLVRLKDQSGVMLASRDATHGMAQFNEISKETVYAEVSSPQSRKSPKKSTKIDASKKSTISVIVSDDYCEASAKTGNIRVKVIDSATGRTISGDVSLFDNGDSRVANKFVNGEDRFNGIDAGEYYYLTASASGYEDYFGKSENFYLDSEDTIQRTIAMHELSAPLEATGSLELCVSGDEGGIEHSGEVGILDVEGQLIKTGRLTQCSLFRGRASGKGCFIFDLPAGKQVFAQVTQAPTGCTESEPSGPFVIEENDKEIVRIELDCSFVGEVRAIVYNSSGNAVTEQCTVELYYENKTKIKTLELSEDGNYTESVPLRGGEEVYAYAKSPPAGYLATKSSKEEIEAGEEITLEVDLDLPPPPPPNLSIIGASISNSVMRPGDNFTVFAQDIRINDDATSPADGVSLECRTPWDQTLTAAYNSSWGEKWQCYNLSVPESFAGSNTVEIKAKKDGANADTRTFDIFVINDSETGLLRIEENKDSLTQDSPVTLRFNVSWINIADYSDVRLAPSLEEAYLLVYNEDGAKRLVRNESLQKVSKGIYTATVSIPFTGPHSYRVYARYLNPLDSKYYIGSLQDSFYTRTAGGPQISCGLSEELLLPGQAVNVSSELTFMGDILPDYALMMRAETADGELNFSLSWDEASETYYHTLQVPKSECRTPITCYLARDPDIYETTNAMVLNPDAPGVTDEDCDFSSYSNCDSLQEARGCFKIYRDFDDSYYEYALGCARNALSRCLNDAPHYSECSQSMRFKVRASGGGQTKTSNYLYFNLLGKAEGHYYANILASLDLPQIPGADDVSYSLVDVDVPGGATVSQSTVNSPVIVLSLNTRTGELEANIKCNIFCGEDSLGDLDNDGDLDSEDIDKMKNLVDSVDIMGIETMDPWPPGCADLNGDGSITYDDYLCLIPGAGCLTCENYLASAGLELSDYEICNNGYDDDCDGQTDKDTYDNEKGELYSPASGESLDICDCSSKTPCEIIFDADGTPPNPSNEGQAHRCLSLSKYGGEYRLYDYDSWKCDAEMAGEYLVCDGKSFSCIGGQWTNIQSGEDYPSNFLGDGEVALPLTHSFCDHDSRSCVASPGKAREDDELCETYDGDCAYNRCDPDTDSCIIIEEPGESECRSDHYVEDCEWGGESIWSPETIAYDCQVGYLIADFDCIGSCDGDRAKIRCQKLPKGVTWGDEMIVVEGKKINRLNCITEGRRRKGTEMYAYGFSYNTGNQNTMKLRCRNLNGELYSGVERILPQTDDKHPCPDGKYLSALHCGNAGCDDGDLYAVCVDLEKD